jgi:RNA polymerase-binding transcription factor DksA
MKKVEELTESQLEELRGALEAEKDAVDEELSAHGKVAGGEWEGSSESEGEEADPSDAADNIEELAINVPLVAELEARRKDIKNALEKFEKGTYGECETCGEPIGFDRLEADAAARTCIAHA